MRKEDRVLLERRVGESIVCRYRETNPPEAGDPAVIQDLLIKAGLPAADDEWDLIWLGNHPGITVKKPLELATEEQLKKSYKDLYGVDWLECPEPWLPGYVRVFASHISADRVLVSEVRDALRTCGIDMFVAHVDINPTAEWQTVIEQALSTCHALVVFMTPDFHESLWTDQEVGFVYGRGVLVLSLMMGRAPYGFLYKTQGLSVVGNTSKQIADRILDTFLGKPALNDVLSEGLLTTLEESNNYVQANARITTLQRVTRWPRLLVEPLSASNAFNGQVDGAYSVPYGVADLLGRVDG